MSKALESLFAVCEELEASDVHVMAGRKPSFRVRGSLAPNGDFRELEYVGTDPLEGRIFGHFRRDGQG